MKSWHNTGRDFVREQVRKRDGHTCQICKRKQKEDERSFDVHHLKDLCGKRSRGYDRAKDMKKLITYCHKCHMGLHSNRIKMGRKNIKNFYKTKKGLNYVLKLKAMRKSGMTYDLIAKKMAQKQGLVHVLVNK